MAIPSLMLAGWLLQKLTNKDLELKLLDVTRDRLTFLFSKPH